MKTEITQERLRELFDYKDGALIRKTSIQSRSMAGMAAGGKGERGAFLISIDHKRYKLHRMIWLWHFGYLPTEIDHRDGNPSNNAIENLRAAEHIDNMKNVKKPITNTSGFKGVRFHKQRGKWTAQICFNRRQKYLGIFKTPELAYEAYCEAAKLHHGEFARLA